MYYRITRLDRYPNKLVVQDVIESKEKLMANFNEKVGTVVFKEFEEKDFLAKVKKAINGCKSIVAMDCNGSEYHIEWVESSGDDLLWHDDILDFGDDQALLNKMNRLLKRYRLVDTETRKKVIKKYVANTKEDSIFKRSWDALLEYNKTGQFPPMDKKDITEMFKYIKDHKDYFTNCPLKWPTDISKAYMAAYHSIPLFMILAALGVVLSFLSGWPIFLLPSGYATYSAIQDFRESKKMEHYVRLSIVMDYLEAMENEIDPDYLDSLNMQNSPESKVSFVDFIERDLNFLRNHPEYEFAEEVVYGLGVEYSVTRWRELGSPYEGEDKEDFIKLLLEVEYDMYKSNTRKGKYNREPNVGFDYLYEILEYLGWSKEQVRSDPFVYGVRSSMRTVIENPYEGCEAELIKMIDLTVSYLSMNGVGTVPTSQEERAIYEDAKKTLDEIFDEVCRKINEANQIESKIREIEKREEKGDGTKTPKSSAKKIEFKPL